VKQLRTLIVQHAYLSYIRSSLLKNCCNKYETLESGELPPAIFGLRSKLTGAPQPPTLSSRHRTLHYPNITKQQRHLPRR